MTSKSRWAALLCLGFFAACFGKDEATGGGAVVISGAGRDDAPGGEGPGTSAGGSQIQGGGNQGGKPIVLGGAGGTSAGEPPIEAGAAGALHGAGGDGPMGPEQLTLCARLTQKGTHADRLALAFDKAVYQDPCVGWVTTLYEVKHARPDFLNQLSDWSMELWGCEGDGVEDFGLIYEPAPLSAGDVELLIEHYLTLATSELKLSPGELSEMRAAIERLGEKATSDPSELPSHSECLGGPGGAGGGANEGGAPSSVAGAAQGGAP